MQFSQNDHKGWKLKTSILVLSFHHKLTLDFHYRDDIQMGIATKEMVYEKNISVVDL